MKNTKFFACQVSFTYIMLSVLTLNIFCRSWMPIQFDSEIFNESIKCFM